MLGVPAVETRSRSAVRRVVNSPYQWFWRRSVENDRKPFGRHGKLLGKYRQGQAYGEQVKIAFGMVGSRVLLLAWLYVQIGKMGESP
jgi:hypothetical protein